MTEARLKRRILPLIFIVKNNNFISGIIINQSVRAGRRIRLCTERKQ